MISTVASGDTEPYVGIRDLAMMYSVADIEGLNRLSRQVIANGALAMVGMVANDPGVEVEDRPTVAITMFGVTTPCVQTALALPLAGVSMIDVEGEDFHDPEADRALFDALRAGIDDDVDLLEVDTDINDESFAESIAGKLDEYMREAGVGPDD